MPAHSATEQDRRLLEALRIHPVTTIEAANDLDIVHPPSAVRRLRRRGFDIRTQWAYQATEAGRPPHRVGQYVLMQETAA